MPDIFQQLSTAMDRRYNEITRAADIAGGVTRYSVYQPISNAGELILPPCTFPVLFVEKPVFFWGAEADPASALVNGNFPIISPLVASWIYSVDTVTGIKWYSGANVIVMSTGVDVQTLILGCHFEGRALRGPV